MPLQINGVLFDELTADPGSPAEGQIWFRSDLYLFRVYRNGVVTSLTDKVAFDAHATSTSNPHSTTLEQARTAGSTLSGSINMGTFPITNIGTGSVSTDAAQRGWVTDQINSKVAGLDWQESVLSRLGTPPGSPVTGDRYLIAAITFPINAVNQGTPSFTVTGDASALVATNTFKVTGSTGNDGTYTVVTAVYGAPNTVITVVEAIPSATADGNIAYASGTWNGKVDQIAQYTGAVWSYAAPNEGFTTRVEAENVFYTYDGTSWGLFGATVDHGSLTGLGDDDHTQYLLVSGTRSMTGNLNMGTFSITNVNQVDGVDVSAHASRHNPGGADALTTAAPGATSVATASAVGTALSFARSDHVHQSNTAPADVTKAAAAIGTSGEPARADHKHDISTGTPGSITDATNAEGSATSLARSDHQHAHGNRGGGTLHSLTSASGHGFAPQSNFAASANPTVNDDGTVGYVPGSVWNNTTNQTSWVCISNGTGAAVWRELTNIAGVLTTKSGKVLAASFAGNPKKATVTFTTAFGSTNYAIVLTPLIGAGGVLYSPNVETQTTGSFVINMGSNGIGNLTAVSWLAVLNGEST